MRINVVFTLLRKEFLNIIRDKKSFIVMILLPLLLFPLLIGLVSIILTSFTKVDTTIIFGVNYQVTSEFQEYVESYAKDFDIKIIYKTTKELEEMFANETLGVYVLKDQNRYEIHYDENNTNSIASNMIVEKIYKGYQEQYINDTLTNLNVNYEEIKNSFEVTFVQESVTEMGSLIPSIISMVLVMIISSVCFSVAIDVTTSEKEKGTLETILSLPIKKSELITSKFITVFSLSAMSGLLTYISLFATMYFASDTLKILGVTSISINLEILMIYLVSIILISLLFSGLLLSVTIFSKNLKEAQNSLYPLELFVTFISMLPMFGVNASLKLSAVPFVNISLLFNNALSSNIDWLFVFMTFASSIIFSILLIMVISKLYNQEEILFNTKSLNNLSFKNGKSKTICFNVITSILLAIIIYLLSMYFSIIFIASSKYVLLAIVPVTTLMVLLVSGLISKLDFKRSFKFNKFKVSKLLLLIVLFVCGYLLSNFIVNFISYIFPSIVEDYSAVMDVLTIDNLLLAIIFTAFLPAVTEELLFRGVIFNSFNKKYNTFVAILISALVFGIYHMNWLQGIFAFLLGIILAYSYLKSGSIWVPIILHFINNAFAVLSLHYEFLNFNMPVIVWALVLLASFFIIIGVFYYLENKAKD